MKKLFLFIFFFSCIGIEPNLYDLSFLAQTELVYNYLTTHHGLSPVAFITDDGISLNGLWRNNPDAPYSVIICGGFYPGNKESMATFIDLIPKEANVLLFDARGHGTSDGRFFSQLHTYGLHEYQDIVSAINLVKKTNDHPVIVYGLCAGAFHAARALIELYERQKTHDIAGFIFDSGFVSLLDVLHIPQYHIKESVIPGIFKHTVYQSDSTQLIKQRSIVRMCSLLCAGIMQLVTLAYRPFIAFNATITNVGEKFHLISCPIFFIHSVDDHYSPIMPIQKLAIKNNNTSEWWIDKPSKHASHHLEHTKEYKERLLAFFSKIVNT